MFPNMQILGKYGIDGKYFVDNFFTHVISCEGIITIPQTVIHKRLFEQLGGFSASVLLGADFQREFFLKAAKFGHVITVTEPICLSVPEIETIVRNKSPKYISQGFAVRCGFKGKCDAEEERKFILDIPENDAKGFPELCSEIKYVPPEQSPLKIVLVSGVWEYHHNKLTFYNYFNLLEGTGKLTFVPRLDRIIIPENDLLAADLVIISRGRSENILKVLDYCELFNIPVLYMIDDNWLAIGKDYPELYGTLFGPGSLDYEIFIECLKRSSAVLVYNRVLEEDVKAYARRVLRIPANIYADDFGGNQNFVLPDEAQKLLEWRKQSNGVILGYVGSARFTDIAFRALAKVSADPNLNVKLLLFGNLLPEHQKLFKDNPTTLPFTTYENYAHIMGNLNPDILVAPLENNRTSMSKCPNKYLEYAVSGSAGLYSNIYPYNEFIKHRVNGMLMPTDANENDWQAAIKELIEDQKLRMDIINSAKQDVLDNYETRKISPNFLSMMDQVLDR
jgi:glycosyltransferase involved in cell wall biosynthesis